MPMAMECICCCEIEEVETVKQQLDTTVKCITDHEGFSSVCLDVWVLQTAYFAYRQQFGDMDEERVHE